MKQILKIMKLNGYFLVKKRKEFLLDWKKMNKNHDYEIHAAVNAAVVLFILLFVMFKRR